MIGEVRNMKLIDAVYEVLKGSAAPMGGDEIERTIRERGLYETKGKTLYASIGAAIYTDIKKQGAASRFVKCGKGRFVVAGSDAAKEQSELALGTGHAVPVSVSCSQSVESLQTRRVAARPKSGYVYILTNKCLKGLVKIGKTGRSVDVRSKDLYNTAVPVPYEEYASLKTSKYAEVEELVHRILTKLTRKRVNENREFFRIKPEEALEILRDVATLLDPNDCKFNIPSETDMQPPKRKADIFYCTGGGAKAKERLVRDGFEVLKGSRVSPKIAPSMKVYARAMFDLRNVLQKTRLIVDDVFCQSYVFSSQSAAACLVQGRNSNGNSDWRTADGVKFGELNKGPTT